MSENMPNRANVSPGLSKWHTLEIISKLVIQTVGNFWQVCCVFTLCLLLLFWLYGSGIALLMILVGLGGIFYNIQDNLLYYPEQPPQSRIFVELPATLPYENLFITTVDGVKINMVFIKQPRNRLAIAPTLVFFHGNAGNIGHRMMNAHCLYMYSGYNILLVEYRGYGKSEGTISEKGLYLDAFSAMQYILERKDIDSSKIVIFGRSLGGAVATWLATRPQFARRIFCVIIENSFTSLPKIAKKIFNFGFLQRMPNASFKNQYPSIHRIQNCKVPTLFLSGSADNLVPPFMVEQLYERSGSILKRLVRFQDGTHNETWQCNGYYDAINRFMAEVFQLRCIQEMDVSVAVDDEEDECSSNQEEPGQIKHL